MLLNEKLNDTAQNILFEESAHMFERVINGMATIGSTKILFEVFYGEKSKIVGFS